MDTIIFWFLHGKISFEEACYRLTKSMSNKIYEDCEKYLKNLEYLDEYDFSEFLTYGRSLSNLIEAIENKYDEEFYKKHRIYMFDNLPTEIIKIYFHTRYNIWFQEYIDWVVRKEDGINSKTRKRT